MWQNYQQIKDLFKNSPELLEDMLKKCRKSPGIDPVELNKTKA